jgi:hypothetical protein
VRSDLDSEGEAVRPLERVRVEQPVLSPQRRSVVGEGAAALDAIAVAAAAIGAAACADSVAVGALVGARGGGKGGGNTE